MGWYIVFLKVRRDTLLIIILAFVLILSGRAMTYIAFASSTTSEDGVPVASVMIKGTNAVPMYSIRSNVEAAGFRQGSYIKWNTLITSQRKLPLSDSIENARDLVKKTTIPGTTVTPIGAVDVQVDSTTGDVVVTVVEDFSSVQIKLDNSSYSNNSSTQTSASGNILDLTDQNATVNKEVG